MVSVIEQKPEAACQKVAYLHDLDKSTIMTTLTATVLKNCMDKIYHKEMAIPFLIAKGV